MKLSDITGGQGIAAGINPPVPAADPLKTAGQFMSLKEAMTRLPILQNEAAKSNLDFQDNIQTRQALKNNVVQDPLTGQSSINTGGALSDLTQSNPKAAMELQQQQQDMKQKQLANANTTMGTIGNVMHSVLEADSQQGYDFGKGELKKYGIDVGQELDAHPDWNPDTKQKVAQLALQSMPVNDQISAELNTQRLGIEQQAATNGQANALTAAYNGEPATQNFKNIKENANQAVTAYQNASKLYNSGASNTEKAAAQTQFLASTINQMAGHAPGDHEILSADKYKGVDGRVITFWNNLQHGDIMSPQQMSSMYDLGTQNFDTQRIAQTRVDTHYQNLGYAQQITPDRMGLDQQNMLSSPEVSPNPYNAAKNGGNYQQPAPIGAAAPAPVQLHDAEGDNQSTTGTALVTSRQTIANWSKRNGKDTDAMVAKWQRAGHIVQ